MSHEWLKTRILSLFVVNVCTIFHSYFLCSRPSKGVRPVRRSDEYLKAAPRPSGGGAKKPVGPSSVASRGPSGGGGGKVIDSRSRGNVGGGARRNPPGSVPKKSSATSANKKDSGNKVCGLFSLSLSLSLSLSPFTIFG